MKSQINEIKRMQRIAGIITEGEYRESQLNEDNTQVKKIARDLYSWLKKNGVNVVLRAQTPSSSTGSKQIGSGDASSSFVWYWDDPKTKQTQIEIHLVGDPKTVVDVEKKFLSAYPGLEQYQKSGEGTSHLAFRVREKTTKKGGLVSNTSTNSKPSDQTQAESIDLESIVNEVLTKILKKNK